MKYKRISVALLIGAVFSLSSANAQSETDSTGLPGDNFNLKAALELFKKAKSPEDLEKMLNDESRKVNNLDLNNDGTVDYVRVIDKKDGDAHAIVLQVPVSDKESQDVAVIELEKTGDREAVVQIVGDEDLYGEKTIVEPQEPDAAANFDEDDTFAGGPSASGSSANTPFITINCWDWPFVQFVYGPEYVIWVSPWDWWHRPVWYRPFRPVAWDYFYYSRPRYYHYNYVYVNSARSIRCQQIYRPMRVTSVYVRNRNSVVVNRYRSTRSNTVYNRNYNNGRYNRGEVRGYENRRVDNNRRYDNGNNRRYDNGNNNRIYRQENNNRSNNNRAYPERNYNPGNRGNIERNYNPGNSENVQRSERNYQRIERNNNTNRGNVQFRNPNYNYRERSGQRVESRERRVERRDFGQQDRGPRGGRPNR